MIWRQLSSIWFIPRTFFTTDYIKHSLRLKMIYFSDFQQNSLDIYQFYYCTLWKCIKNAPCHTCISYLYYIDPIVWPRNYNKVDFVFSVAPSSLIWHIAVHVYLGLAEFNLREIKHVICLFFRLIIASN